MKVSNFSKLFKSASTLVVLAALASACGSQSERISDVGTSSGTQTDNTVNPLNPNTGNLYGLPAAPTATFNITGATGDEPKAVFNNLVTETVLRVRVKPLPAPNITVSGYGNWVFPYGCVSMKVSVNGIAKTTKVMRVEGVTEAPNSPCKNAPTEDTLDFANDLGGQGDVSVTVEAANYDNCRLNVSQYGYYGYQFYGCSMSQIWKSHRVTGTVQIQTNSFYMP